MNLDSRILVTGHRGLVGSALLRVLKSTGHINLLTWDRVDVDLCDSSQVAWAFSSYMPEYVFHCAARVGGIVANRDHAAAFLWDNIHMEMNVLLNAKRYECKKVLFYGSACAYPKFASVPIQESALLTGPMEPSNLCYALAKIVGIQFGQELHKEGKCKFVSVMPTNLYGLNDNYHATDSHVIPGMIRKFHEAKLEGKKSVTLWGSGRPVREFLYADDLAEASLFLMDRYDSSELINIGSGRAVRLDYLAGLIAKTVGFSGCIEWDVSQPDGTPNRFLDTSKLFCSEWRPKVSLEEGLALAYADFQKGHRQ